MTLSSYFFNLFKLQLLRSKFSAITTLVAKLSFLLALLFIVSNICRIWLMIILFIHCMSYDRICHSAISTISHWQVFRKLKVISNLGIPTIIVFKNNLTIVFNKILEKRLCKKSFLEKLLKSLYNFSRIYLHSRNTNIKELFWMAAS